jgi:phosphate:Na+ symporter
MYENKVKVLYSAIIDFIIRSQAHLPSVFSEELFRFRQAAADIVQSVKEIKHLRKNVTKYMVSDNEHIRAEYNKIRYRLASILREIYRLRESDEEELESLGMDELKVEIERSHAELNASLNRLLGERQITPFMATSLMNDYSYAEATSWNLINSAQAMLVSHDVLVAETEEEIKLDKEEIEELAASDAA